MGTNRKLLIAARGEIAVRIARSARDLGYTVVAVYSEADSDAPHVHAAHEAYCIGPAAAADSYLNRDALLAAALAAGADTVHPGYGFLSESPETAAMFRAAGIVFVGPDAETMALMGNKRTAREAAEAAGLPVIPGFTSADQDDAALLAAARKLGFPLMVKAAAGGGGRGIRRIVDAAELPALLPQARAEAVAGFGDGELFLERALTGARHVEVQIFGDAHGRVIHLGERDCSVQRRHQKLIEETPAPGLTPAQRQGLHAAAVDLAQSVGYEGAGTVEFLLDADGAFYFLEMNTRLQVEHPVTELVTGLDLVAWQLRVAAGERLPLKQVDVPFGGHAMEARVYAEDPSRDFAPRVGPIWSWQAPAGQGVRVDHALRTGLEVSPHYDAMLAKVAAHGPTREAARRALCRALADTHLLGLETNLGFLQKLLNSNDFASGAVHTGLVASVPAQGPPEPVVVSVAAVLLHEWAARVHPPAWRHWHNGPAPQWAYTLDLAGHLLEVALKWAPRGCYVVHFDGHMHHLKLRGMDDTRAVVDWAGVDRPVPFACRDHTLWFQFDGAAYRVRDLSYAPADTKVQAGMVVHAATAGKVTRVEAVAGETVSPESVLVVIEAMKMAHGHRAGRDAVVAAVHVAAGAQVQAGDLLVSLEAPDAQDA